MILLSQGQCEFIALLNYMCMEKVVRTIFNLKRLGNTLIQLQETILNTKDIFLLQVNDASKLDRSIINNVICTCKNGST